MHLNAAQLEFLSRLGRSPEGQQLQALIRAEIDDVNQQLRTLSGEHLSRAQGRAAYLDDLAAKLAAPTKQQSAVRQASFRMAPGELA